MNRRFMPVAVAAALLASGAAEVVGERHGGSVKIIRRIPEGVRDARKRRRAQKRARKAQRKGRK